VDKGSLTFLAGNIDGWGYIDGSAAQARFAKPMGMARDAQGNIYVADTYNHTVRKISTSGLVTTLAGSPGQRGSADGTGSAARFYSPKGIAVDGSGNVYVADYENCLIRKITPGGVVTTLTGAVDADGKAIYGATDGTLAQARFANPFGLALDSKGNLFVSDNGNGTIRKITPGGVVSTVAGTALTFGAVDGTGAGAQFSSIYFMTVDGQDNLYVADGGNSAIRMVSPAGVVTTFAGTLGQSGYVNDPDKLKAMFNEPYGVAFDGTGAIFVSDTYNQRIRKILPTGEVTDFAGSDAGFLGGFANGAGKNSKFSYPSGIVADATGNLYVADQWNNTIRMVAPTGTTSTFAGAPSLAGTQDGTGSAAQFGTLYGIAADSTGNLIVADTGYHTLRRVTTAGVVTTYAGIAATPGSDPGGTGVSTFKNPYSMTFDSAGNMFVADWGNHTIRKITASGFASTYSGTPAMTGGSTDNPPLYKFPRGVAADSLGNVWVADTANQTIRKIAPAGSVTTVAGSVGVQGYQDGVGSNAQFDTVNDLAVDASGNLVVADAGNLCIRLVNATTGEVTTIAGAKELVGGLAVPAKDGIGTAARFGYPRAVVVNKATNMAYVADRDAHAIRQINLTTKEVKTVVGTLNLPGMVLGSLPGGLYSPAGVAFSNGSLYITTGKGVVVAKPPAAGF
jgi:sugar lactone lactonase YvrE